MVYGRQVLFMVYSLWFMEDSVETIGTTTTKLTTEN